MHNLIYCGISAILAIVVWEHCRGIVQDMELDLKQRIAKLKQRLHNDPLSTKLCPNCLGPMLPLSDGTAYCPTAVCPYFSEYSSITLRPFTQAEADALDSVNTEKYWKLSSSKLNKKDTAHSPFCSSQSGPVKACHICTPQPKKKGKRKKK